MFQLGVIERTPVRKSFTNRKNRDQELAEIRRELRGKPIFDSNDFAGRETRGECNARSTQNVDLQ